MQFFPELYSHIDMNSGEKSEYMFFIKIASKGISLNSPPGFRWLVTRENLNSKFSAT